MKFLFSFVFFCAFALLTITVANTAPEAEKGRFPINDRGWDSWAHPVIIGGKLYIRNQNELNCYDVKAK
jgi:outer membrane protein assembly factor BamB